MEEKSVNNNIDLSVLYRCNQKYFDKLLSKYDLGYTQFVLIRQIYENEGISMNELALNGCFDKGTITKSIQKLEQLGYVKVENSDVDKRSKLLFTEEKARDIMPGLYLKRQEWVNYLTEGMDEAELTVYHQILSGMINKARAYNKLEIVNQGIKIYGLQKLTLLDYPGNMAATVFTGGCNFRCPFCHNRSLVFLNENDGQIATEVVFDYLSKRSKILDGVCITGGEPLLHDGLEDFIKRIKEMGLKVKLDTNGSNFEKLQYLVESGLLDYVAMDIKNCKTLYPVTIGLDNFDVSEVEKCVEYLKTGPVEYEFRTTLVKDFHEHTDFDKVGEWLKGAKNYYLQNFEDSGSCIKEGLSPLPVSKIKEIRETMLKYVDNVTIRGVKE